MPRAEAFDDVSLDVSPQFSQLVGDTITLTGQVTNPGTGDIRYQFATRAAGGAWRIVRDFDITDSIEWATLDEGFHELRVIARDQDTAQEQEATTFYTMDTRIVGGVPAVSPTANPLVTIYSAPPCTVGGILLARFRAAAGGPWTTTPFKTCVAGESTNFYLAGMTADTTHVVHHVGMIDGVFEVGTPVIFDTGLYTLPFAGELAVPDGPDASTSAVEDVLLMSYLGGTDGRFAVATDLAGNAIWYYRDVMGDITDPFRLVRPLAGGTMLFLLNDETGERGRIAEVDLAGNTIRETNIKVLNEALVAQGKDPTNYLHHDAIRLANDYTAVLGTAERILNNIQGPGDVDVVADTVYVLDENFQLVWDWNAFDHLDQTELAILGETCTNGQGGCPPIFLDTVANDWTHSNALDYTAGDGNIIISVRHLDAAIKIDYADGAGGGAVVWRMGRGGDFTMVDPTNDSFPWFSHQHYTHFEDGVFVNFDNGNTRVSEEGGGNSRAQVMVVDEVNMIVQLIQNYDLGSYSFAVGSAEILSNGNMTADSSFLNSGDYPFLAPGDSATLIPELKPDGDPTYIFASLGRIYRTWRMISLYEPSS